jgi:hypothetical protein
MTERLSTPKKYPSCLPGVKIEKETEVRLLAYCASHQISMSDAVRQGLTLLLDREAPVAPLRSDGGTSA